MKVPPSETSSDLRPPAGWVLWGAFLVTPILWFAYFMAAYVFNEAVCGATERVSTGIDAPTGTITLVATAIVTVLVAAGTYGSWRVRRRARHTREIRDDFLPHVGFPTGLLFTLVMVAHLIQVAMVGVC